MIVRLLCLALVLVLGGCATSSPTRTTSTTTTVLTRAGTVELRTDARVEATHFPSQPNQVLTALLAAYEAVGIAVGIDRVRGEVGNPSFVLTQRSGQERVSTFLTCGSTAGVTDVADSYRVEVSLLSTVTALPGGGSLVETAMLATARDHFTSSSPRNCVSRGVFERRIVAALQERLGVTGRRATVPAAGPRAASPLAPAATPAAELPQPPLPLTSPVLLAVTGTATGLLGVYLGGFVGRDCVSHCADAKGTLWPLVAGTTLAPLGVHVANGRKGSYLRSFMIASGWALAGAVAAGVTDEPGVLWFIAPGQILSSVLIERASSHAERRP